MNLQQNPELKFSKDDFALDFEITADAMELSGDLETLSVITKLATKVTCKSTCTCNCTSFCTMSCF
ncbi:hypothetical protein ACH0B5_09355 [Ureibacillus sp. 179-F W5.1 NHS]|uniref:Uncharacterized protein n=1 Tax=Lysinibacillus halotolerans TaxID=1368476 RepID=A0A3M8H4X1_9BACI|nr:hypothetical protein [Lysinibacillus halotolerans]RNC97264.1 hypothetical protein EC501_16175 [Lysinibacillus halotolerans]